MKSIYARLPLFLGFAVLVAGIVVAGVSHYRSQLAKCRADAQANIADIADLKVDELLLWRKERLRDANVLYKNAAFSSLVRRCFERPDDLTLQEELRSWMSNIRASDQYDRIGLYNTANNEWTWFSDAKEPVSAVTVEKANAAERSGQIIFSDFCVNEHTQKVHIHLFVPILDNQVGGRAIGVLVLRIDPSVFLYSLLQHWPTPSRTSEILLVRREGDEVVFLNESKLRKNAALGLRIPLEDTSIPAVKAALGETGSFENIDYRGTPVLAAIRAVPDSPWFLVAKLDAEEVYAPMRAQFWMMFALVCATVTIIGLSLGLVWRRQRIWFYRERLEAAEALRQSEKKYDLERRYRAILDQTFEFVGLLTPDGTLIEANHAALEIAGVKESDVLGKPFWETPWWTHSTEMQDRLRDAIKAAANGEFVRFEATHPASPEGEMHYVDFSLKPVKNDEGEVVFLIPEGRDVTDRKRAEEGMREFETRFRDIIDNSREGVIFVDTDARTIFSGNRAMGELLGRSPEELSGMPISEIHPADTFAEVIREFEQHRNGDRHFSSDIPVIRKDGSILYADITSTTVMLNGVEYLAGFFRDVTDRKRAEEALHESEQRFRSLVENASDIFYTLTPDGIFSYVSPNSLDLMGEAAANAIGKPFTNYVHADDVHLCWEFLERVLTTAERLRSVEYRVLRPDGTIRWHSSKVSPIRDRDGNIVGFAGIARDITEREQVQETLRQHTAELAAHNEELARFNLAATGRELRMIELKREVNELCRQFGQPPRYPLQFADAPTSAGLPVELEAQAAATVHVSEVELA